MGYMKIREIVGSDGEIFKVATYFESEESAVEYEKYRLAQQERQNQREKDLEAKENADCVSS